MSDDSSVVLYDSWLSDTLPDSWINDPVFLQEQQILLDEKQKEYEEARKRHVLRSKKMRAFWKRSTKEKNYQKFDLLEYYQDYKD